MIMHLHIVTITIPLSGETFGILQKNILINTISCLEAFIYHQKFQFVELRLYFSPESWFRMSDCLIEAVVEAVSLSGVSNVLSESVQPTS